MDNIFKKVNEWAHSSTINKFFMGAFFLFLVLDISRGNYIWACIDILVLSHTGILLARLSAEEEIKPGEKK